MDTGLQVCRSKCNQQTSQVSNNNKKTSTSCHRYLAALLDIETGVRLHEHLVAHGLGHLLDALARVRKSLEQIEGRSTRGSARIRVQDVFVITDSVVMAMWLVVVAASYCAHASSTQVPFERDAQVVIDANHASKLRLHR